MILPFADPVGADPSAASLAGADGRNGGSAALAARATLAARRRGRRVTMSDELERTRSALGDAHAPVGEPRAARGRAGGTAARRAAGAERARRRRGPPGGRSRRNAARALRTHAARAGRGLPGPGRDGRPALPAALGVGLGLGYAAFWQLRADREALAGRRESAAFHALASSVIAFPLIWEATSRFALLSRGRGVRAARRLLRARAGGGLAPPARGERRADDRARARRRRSPCCSRPTTRSPRSGRC